VVLTSTVRTRAGSRALLACALSAVLLAGCTEDATEPAPRPDETTDSDARPDGGQEEPDETTPADEPDESPEAEEPEPLRSFTMAVSGDVLPHTGVWESAEQDAAARGKRGYDFRPMFASMKPVYSGVDLAVCHLETPLASPDGPFLNYPVFSSPPQVLPALRWAGIDACTTASNHSVDQGFEGVVRTLDQMDAEGMDHTGTARTRKEANTPLILDVAGVRVGLLSYTYGTNGLPVDSDKPWSVNLIDTDAIIAEATRAREAGAETVVVALHDGLEYQVAPSEHQLDVYDELTASPHIDLVYGHHAHVVQPFDVVNGEWVAYGLGNFVAQQLTSQPETYRGMTARFEFSEQEDGSFVVEAPTFVPTMITMTMPMRVLDVRSALADPETDPGLKPELRTTLDEVKEDAFSLGAKRKGLQVAAPAA
jgi:poly-gamma-glutamate synthesis protein (capsule biosynthesis protein)